MTAAVTGALIASGVPAAASVPGDDTWCPREDRDGLRTSRLVDRRVSVARGMAERNGCDFRIVKRNGEWLAITTDYSNVRVNVVVRHRHVRRVHGVY